MRLFIPFFCYFLYLFVIGCKNNKQVEKDFIKTTNTSVSKPASKKLKIYTIPVENNQIAGYAFLLPENWNANGYVAFKSQYGITPFLTIHAANKNNNINMIAKNEAIFNYSKSYAQTLQQMKMMANQYGSPNMQTNPNFRAPIAIEQYTNHEIIPQYTATYQVLSQERVYDFYVKPTNYERNVLKTELLNSNNPNQKAILYTIQFIYNVNSDFTTWETLSFFIEGPKAEANKLIEIPKLVANTIDVNPIYANYIAKLNNELTEINKRNYNITQNSLQGASDYFFSTFRSIQENSNATHNQISEMRSNVMLDVTTYINPTDGSEITLPTTNQFSYTNNLGDFLTTNNPLFDPNTKLTSTYNWVELQKKF